MNAGEFSVNNGDWCTGRSAEYFVLRRKDTNLFQSVSDEMKPPSCATSPPMGDGAQWDSSVLPVREYSKLSKTRNAMSSHPGRSLTLTVRRQVLSRYCNWGMPTRRGQSPQERQTSKKRQAAMTKSAGSIGSNKISVLFQGAP
jgi:hypothetical protein